MTDIQVRSEPLTYDRDAPHSYFRDLIFAKRDADAENRLSRHRDEMAVITEERDAERHRALTAAGFETRVAPSRTQGNGGYFAPPLWLVDLFATAPRAGRVVAALAPNFGLPQGCQSVNIPILSTGTAVGTQADNAATPGRDVVDTSGSSQVVTISGEADVPLQLLEQSPPGAHLDWAMFRDLSEAYDAKFEAQLVNGSGAGGQLAGLLTAAATATQVAYTDASPTPAEFYVVCGQAAAAVGNNRLMPPEVWLMRTSRWAWLSSATPTAFLPPLLPPWAMPAEGKPMPVGSVAGWPVFPDDAIPATLGATGNQDAAVSCRPSDMLVFEADPRTAVMEDVLSGTLGVRLQLRNYVAAILGRKSSGIGTVTGTGMVVPSGY